MGGKKKSVKDLRANAFAANLVKKDAPKVCQKNENQKRIK
jgi:hypothetical protein